MFTATLLLIGGMVMGIITRLIIEDSASKIEWDTIQQYKTIEKLKMEIYYQDKKMAEAINKM